MIRKLLLLIAAGLFFCFGTDSAEATKAEEEAEWTVLFYFCGSDLESRHSYATGNLQEIAKTVYPDDFFPLAIHDYNRGKNGITEAGAGKVNVLVQTGGCSKWHAESLGMNISRKALQRWQYRTFSIYEENQDLTDGFHLLETLPLASMSAHETLTDFIRWGAQSFPARKYALVLWDHGGGAATGLLTDEIFQGDVMYLYELKQALEDSGVQLEAVIIDACMMANIETAWSIKDSARWLIASEETVPGEGTAIGDWLQELYFHPECDGRQLGRMVCDMTQIKYGNKADSKSQSILTWSVIDLSGIDRLAEAVEHFFREIGEIYERYPDLAIVYASAIQEAEEYGDGHQNMLDLASVLYNRSMQQFLNHDIRNEMLDALSETVVYTAHGHGRSEARGLSFCYPTDFSVEALQIYEKNFPRPWYLAYLDAVTDWTAPDWVYDTAKRLPEIRDVEMLQLTAGLTWTQDGFPALTITNLVNNLKGFYYRLYQVDEATGQIRLLGRTTCNSVYQSEEKRLVFYANEPWKWPSIDGVPCEMDLVEEQYREGDSEMLYNIPILINSNTCFLRCGRIDKMQKDAEQRSYEVYGIWEGYDNNSMMTNRSVKSLAQMAGQEYRLAWYVDGTNGKYALADQRMRMYRALDVTEMTLPAGTYYLEYEVDDMFMRPMLLERIQMYWDGQQISFPEGFTWEGSFRLK